MTPNFEFEGKNVDKAVMIACEQLNILREDLRYDVISYGSTGIFGLVGAKKAKIRVSMPESDEKKVLSSNVKEPKTKSASDKKDKAPLTDSVKPQATEAVSVSQPVSVSEESPAHEAGDDINSVELGVRILERIVGLITEGAVVTVDQSPERILFNVEGGNSAILIGKRGQTLEALQYIVEKVVNKHSMEKRRVQIDVEGYLEAKRDRLQKLAERLSIKVKLSGKPVTAGQMNSHDRRIIHLALKEDTDVRTQSVGDGLYRKLMIFPGKSFQRKRRQG
ncbi:MAG: Jag N-terminal domain-containing protein [Desulfobacterales bacterium]|nr:Jag N-terminal domain-containing protein [Desulfobacterales bacterium]MDD4071472.1 Jag N-terminal domain-containing protein [Desulfobacterales bacterium]MDD4393196.1 Jag N-terminal domain-containing protein [Desulfobacterales bacterium]